MTIKSFFNIFAVTVFCFSYLKLSIHAFFNYLFPFECSKLLHFFRNNKKIDNFVEII